MRIVALVVAGIFILASLVAGNCLFLAWRTVGGTFPPKLVSIARKVGDAAIFSTVWLLTSKFFHWVGWL